MTEPLEPTPEEKIREQAQDEIQRRRHHRNKLLFLIFAGAIGIMLLVVGGYQLIEFTDSTAFCGRLCHDVMYPEYTAYQASPHSRVACSECHVGPGADYLVKSKVSGVPLIFATLSGHYDRPIPTPVENLRPARETCEQCHRPERFSGDIVRVHTTYDSDEKNTSHTDTRVLRVGGGDQEVAQGIHWHIAAKVWYIPTDRERQNIAWVGVETADGLVEYADPKNPVDPSAANRRLMDCMDCHNRATHIFRSPGELIDAALAQGAIDAGLPYMKREALKALEPPNASLEEAMAKVNAIRDFYRASYPDILASKQGAVDRAIVRLQDTARLTTFPEMKIDWNTYVDNISHQESPGCFRCHGKLVAMGGGEKGKAIDSDCSLCHYFELKK